MEEAGEGGDVERLLVLPLGKPPSISIGIPKAPTPTVGISSSV